MGPVKIAGPPPVWNLRVSTPEDVRVKSKFLNAVKYEGSVTGMWELLCRYGGRVVREDARSSGARLAPAPSVAADLGTAHRQGWWVCIGPAWRQRPVTCRNLAPPCRPLRSWPS